MALSAGSYRMTVGNRVYAHDTGGKMTGRAVAHAESGNILASLGMHAGGVRLGTIARPWMPQHYQARVVKLSAVPIYIRYGR